MEQRIIMKRIDQILSHPVFREQFALLQEAEKDRIFCRHTMEHFLDVARLMYIYNLEDQAGFSKEMIYATGLLHDIGRYEQMEKVLLTIWQGQDWRNASLRTVIFLLLSRNRFLLRSEATG